jgi:4-amino-4-deoxy-L-arabinose transferase-like glycosyltransferase
VRRAPLGVIVIILLIGAALRLGGLASNTRAVLADDHLDYHTIAVNLVGGRGYDQVEGFAYGRQPGWPLLLAGVYALGGPHPEIGAWATALLGVLAVALTFQIGRRVGGRRCGWIAAGFAAIDPFLIVQDQTLLTESLYTAVGLAAVWALLILPARRGRSGARLTLVLGGLLAFAILVRSNGVGLLAGLWGARSPLRRAGVAAALCGLLLIPWAVRNERVGAGFTPFAPQTGQLLLGSYNTLTRDNSEAYGMWLYPKQIPEGAPFADLPYLPRESAWSAQGWAFIRANVAALPVMAFRRVARLVFQLGYIPRDGLAWWVLAAQPISYGVLLVGALCGALLMALRRATTYLRIVVATMLPALILAALFYGEARFRAPFHPLLAVLGAYFWAGFGGKRRRA